jgi:hypothetical protein
VVSLVSAPLGLVPLKDPFHGQSESLVSRLPKTNIIFGYKTERRKLNLHMIKQSSYEVTAKYTGNEYIDRGNYYSTM